MSRSVKEHTAQPQLVIMAAGIGSRWGGLKQIHPIGPGGEIIVDYSVYDALRAGFGTIIFVISREIERPFREKLSGGIEGRADVRYVFQEMDALPRGFACPAERSKPWGTAHAVLCAQQAVTGTFAVINADDYYGPKSFQILADFLRSASDGDGPYDYAMVGFVLRNTVTEHGYVSRGVCTTNDEGHLRTIVEHTRIESSGGAIRSLDADGKTWRDLDPDSVTSMNMWGFTPSLLGEIQRRFVPFLKKNADNLKAEYFLPAVVNELVREGKARVKVLPTPEKWLGVTYQEDKGPMIEAIRDRVQSGLYPERLWA